MKPPRKSFTKVFNIVMGIFFVAHFVLNMWKGNFEVASWVFIAGSWFFMHILAGMLTSSMWKLIDHNNKMMDSFFMDLINAKNGIDNAPDKLPDGSIKSPIQIRRFF